MMQPEEGDEIPLEGEGEEAAETAEAAEAAEKPARGEVWVVQKGIRAGAGGSEEEVDNIAEIDFEHGEFTMDIKYCMPPWLDGTHPYDVPEIYDIACTGIFNPEETPELIVTDILSYYAGLQYERYTYKLPEFSDELSPLAPIGVYFDRETEIFSAIEKIQNSSDYAFQLRTDFDKFTAKRNDDQREISGVIKKADILNIDEIEYDMNAGEYATIVDVAYAENHMGGNNREDKYEHLQDKRNRKAVMRMYHLERQYNAVTGLREKSGAQKKADRLIN
jgi:hypothetical protein